MNNKEWIKDCDNQGNSFLPQIYKLGYYDKNEDQNLRQPEKSGVSKYNLSINEWIDVLNLFTYDLDKIIYASPPLKHDIYCYRGVQNHYIDTAGYIFNEPTSFTFAYYIASRFSSNAANRDTGCIYRTTITKNSKALFIAPISSMPDEVEILIPSRACLIFNYDQITGQVHKPVDSVNNFNNKYALCSNTNFKSLDIIISTSSDISYHFKNPPQVPHTEINIYSDFSIVTANIFELKKCNNDIKKQQLIIRLTKNNPLIICLQESTYDFKLLMEHNKYELIHDNSNNNHELIQFYIKKDEISNIENIKTSNKTSELCYTTRSNIIIELIYKKTTIKIGVVHLCGGIYDEQFIDTSIEKITTTYDKDEVEQIEFEIFKSKAINKIEEQLMQLELMISNHSIINLPEQEEERIKYKDNQLKEAVEKYNKLFKLKKIKIEQIKDMIDNNVDIILGDFNSDFEYHLGIENEDQIYFFLKNKFDTDMISIWNKSIFELLEKNKYISFCTDKCNDLYNKMHTSINGTSPDVIYYKPDKLNINQYELVDLLHNRFSDHNGIYANFNLGINGGKIKKTKKK
jgi:hypothetical protein